MQYNLESAHYEQYRKWIVERAKSGELAKTLKRRHITIEIPQSTIKLPGKINRPLNEKELHFKEPCDNWTEEQFEAWWEVNLD